MLSMAGMMPSISLQAFASAFSSIHFNCSDHWDRSKYWAINPKLKLQREKDKDFCQNQASSTQLPYRFSRTSWSAISFVHPREFGASLGWAITNTLRSECAVKKSCHIS
jgi:hypothetical protein